MYKEYGDYQRFDYNTFPIHIPWARIGKVVFILVVAAVLVATGLIAFWATYTVAVAALAYVPVIASMCWSGCCIAAVCAGKTAIVVGAMAMPIGIVKVQKEFSL